MSDSQLGSRGSQHQETHGPTGTCVPGTTSPGCGLQQTARRCREGLGVPCCEGPPHPPWGGTWVWPWGRGLRPGCISGEGTLTPVILTSSLGGPTCPRGLPSALSSTGRPATAPDAGLSRGPARLVLGGRVSQPGLPRITEAQRVGPGSGALTQCLLTCSPEGHPGPRAWRR